MTTEKLIETIDELDAAKKEIIRLNQKYDYDTNMAEQRREGETDLLEWKRKKEQEELKEQNRIQVSKLTTKLELIEEERNEARKGMFEAEKVISTQAETIKKQQEQLILLQKELAREKSLNEISEP